MVMRTLEQSSDEEKAEALGPLVLLTRARIDDLRHLFLGLQRLLKVLHQPVRDLACPTALERPEQKAAVARF